MKLLMFTRKVDKEDVSPAAPTYNFVKKLAERLEKLYVLTWQKSKKEGLLPNTEIVSLPKNKIAKIIILQVKLLSNLPKVDGVFCHQNPEYTILAAPFAKIFRKKIVSWYTHKDINWRRHLMERLSDKILTASKESFREPLFPEKIQITGHGIDIEKFQISNLKPQTNSKFIILSIGRISPVKNYETLIEAIEILLKEKGVKEMEVKIIGAPVMTQDKEYLKKLKEIVQEKKLGKYIKFWGGVSHHQILSYYQNCDLFINLSQTNSVDKAVLEAMACQRLVLTSNEAFRDILRDERLMFGPKNSNDLANKITALMNLSEQEKEKISRQLREEVVKNHNLDNLIEKIITVYGK